MRLVEFFNRLDEKRPPREMYHGTSSEFLRTILKQGIVPDPAKKKWDVDPDHGESSLSRVSLPGSYWTSNYMTAFSSATRTVQKFGGEPLMVIGMISEGRAYADEDNINTAIMNAVPQTYREVFGSGISSDAVPKILAGIYWGTDEDEKWIRRQAADQGATIPEDTKLQRHLYVTYGLLVHKELSANPQQQKIPWTLLREIFEALMLRGMAWEKQQSKYGSHRLTDYQERVEKGIAPELPSTEEIEQTLLKLRDELTQTYRKTAFYTPDMFAHTLRTPEPVTYRGSNRIIGIIQTPKWREQDNPPLIIHYGQITEGYLEQYRSRVGKFPGAVNRQGQMVIPPDEPMQMPKAVGEMLDAITAAGGPVILREGQRLDENILATLQASIPEYIRNAGPMIRELVKQPDVLANTSNAVAMKVDEILQGIPHRQIKQAATKAAMSLGLNVKKALDKTSKPEAWSRILMGLLALPMFNTFKATVAQMSADQLQDAAIGQTLNGIGQMIKMHAPKLFSVVQAAGETVAPVQTAIQVGKMAAGKASDLYHAYKAAKTGGPFRLRQAMREV